jgi:hypothetical protein
VVSSRLKVVVGRPWPNLELSIEELPISTVGKPWPDLEVQVEKPPIATRDDQSTTKRVVDIFGVTLAALTVYAVIVQKDPLIHDIFELVKFGMVSVVSFIFGRHTGTR